MTANDGRDGADAGVDVPDGDVTVLLIDDDETWLRTNARVLERQREGFGVLTATDLPAARDVYDERAPDCVVCDYQLDAGDGIDMLEHVRATDPDRPFVMVTGEGSEALASDAIGRRVTDYIRKADVAGRVDLLARRIDAAVRTYRTERALERERRSKDAMLDIVTATTTREGLAADFCRHLVAERDYACAWVGTYAPANGVVPQAAAGAEGYVNAVLPPGTAADAADEPALRALASAEPCTVTDVRADPASGPAVAATNGDGESREARPGADPDPTGDDERADDHSHSAEWRAVARSCGFRSAAAVPIEHNGTAVGVLAVYARDPNAVTDAERDLLTDYGTAIGYALRTAEWKESLFSATSVATDVTVEDRTVPLVALCRALPAGTTATVRTAALRNDGELLYVADVTGAAPGPLRDAAARVDSVSSVTVGTTGDHAAGDDVQCDVVVCPPTPEQLLVESGARFLGASADASGATVSVATTGRTPVADFERTLASEFDDVAIASMRADPDVTRTATLDDLTSKQRQALRLAYHGGYFERPRRHNTTELAERLDVSRATFTQHVRTALRKLLADPLERRT